MKTIKQIADELGIDKQKVYRFIVKNHITASDELKQSKLYDETAENLIKSHFSHIITSKERYSKPHQKVNDDILLMQLLKELEVKNEQIREKDKQLEEKDNQIAALNSRLEESHRLLDQEQQLHASAKLLEIKEEVEQEEQPSRRWWQIWR